MIFKKRFGIFFYLLVMIVMLFLGVDVCKAQDSYIESSIVDGKDEITLIVSIKEGTDIYGFLGNFNYDQEKLVLNSCDSDNFDITLENGMLLAESIKGYNNTTLVTCDFSIVKSGSIEPLSITDITLSNKEMVLNNEDIVMNISNQMDVEVIEPSVDTEITNPPTGVNVVLIVIVIVIILALVLLFFVNKKYKLFLFIVTLGVVLYPISIWAVDANLDVTRDEISEIRDILLKRSLDNSNNKYDYDKDNKLTINDLIVSLIEFNTPNISYNSEEVKGTGSYYTSASRVIKVDSESEIKTILYCVTTSGECTPNKQYEYNNDNLVKIGFTDNAKSQKICISVENELGFERTLCDSKSYNVDSKVPVITVKNKSVSIESGTDYDAKTNVAATYGVGGGSISCDTKLNVGTNTAKCVATGNNGLTASASFEIVVTEPERGTALDIDIEYGVTDSGGRCGTGSGDYCAAVATVKYARETVKYYVGYQNNSNLLSGSCRSHAFISVVNAIKGTKYSTLDLQNYIETINGTGVLKAKEIDKAIEYYSLDAKAYHSETSIEECSKLIKDALDNGKPVMIFVAHDKCSDLAGTHHALLLLGYDNDGNVIFVDSVPYSKSAEKRDVDELAACISGDNVSDNYFRMIIFNP